MSLFTAPKSFARQLQSFDPLLRVRYSDFEGRWRIERKITRGKSMDPGLFLATDYEEFVARQAGYLPILFCTRELQRLVTLDGVVWAIVDQLDDRVFLTLWAADMHRQGGAVKVHEEAERMKEEGRQRSRAKYLDDVYYRAVERYNYANALSAQKHQLESWEGKTK